MQAGADLRTAMESALSRQQMSVSALAREANVQRADIYRWWRGEQRPSRNSLARIAGPLGVDIAYLRAALGDAPSTGQPTISAEVLDAIEERVRRTLREELQAAIRELRGEIE